VKILGPGHLRYVHDMLAFDRWNMLARRGWKRASFRGLVLCEKTFQTATGPLVLRCNEETAVLAEQFGGDNEGDDERDWTWP